MMAIVLGLVASVRIRWPMMIMLMRTIILMMIMFMMATVLQLSQDKVSMMLLMVMLQCQRQGEDAGQIGGVVQTMLTNSKVKLGGLD